MDTVTLTNFDAENFIRVFLGIYFDHQVKVVDVFKDRKEGDYDKKSKRNSESA